MATARNAHFYAKGPQRPKPQAPEHELQVTVATYLQWALPPGWLWTATLNGAHLGRSQRIKMKAAGLRKGIPDLILCSPHGVVYGIELKAGRNTLEPDQEAWRDALGPGRWALCRTPEEVEAAIIRFGVRPRVPLEKANRYAV
jgi:hypothetical protein